MRWFACLLALILMAAGSAAWAEEDSLPYDYSRCIFHSRACIAQAKDILWECLNASEDANEYQQLSALNEQTSFLFQLLTESMNETATAPTLPEGLDVLTASYLEGEAQTLLQSPWISMEEYGVIAAYDLVYEEGCAQARCQVCAPDGTLMGIYQTRFAQRENGPTLAVFIGYDASSDSTVRGAILTDANGLNALCRTTYGKITEILLDAEAWAHGEDFESWSETLLFPAELES